MAVTRPADILFSPSLVADIVDARWRESRIGRILATEYFDNISDKVTPNKSGKTIDIPIIVDDPANPGIQEWTGAAIVPNKMIIDSVSAPITTSAISFHTDIDAWDLIANSEDPDTLIGEYVEKKIEEFVFSAILVGVDAAAAAGDMSHATTPTGDNYLSYSAVDAHATNAFGDLYNSDETVLMIAHSKALYDFKQDPAIQTSLSRFGRDVTNNPWLDVANLRIVNSDSVRTSGSGVARDFHTYLLLPGAVKFYWKMVDVPMPFKRVSDKLDLENMFAVRTAVAINPTYVVPVASLISNSSLA